MATQSTEERLVYTVEEAADRLRLSKSFVYKQVAAGIIPSIKIGRRHLVQLAALEKMLAAAG